MLPCDGPAAPRRSAPRQRGARRQKQHVKSPPPRSSDVESTAGFAQEPEWESPIGESAEDILIPDRNTSSSAAADGVQLANAVSPVAAGKQAHPCRSPCEERLKLPSSKRTLCGRGSRSNGIKKKQVFGYRQMLPKESTATRPFHLSQPSPSEGDAAILVLNWMRGGGSGDKKRRSRRCCARYLRRLRLTEEFLEEQPYYDVADVSVCSQLRMTRRVTKRNEKLLPLDTLSGGYVNYEKLLDSKLSEDLKKELQSAVEMVTNMDEFRKRVDEKLMDVHRVTRNYTVENKYHKDLEDLLEMKKVLAVPKNTPAPQGPTVGYFQIPKSSKVRARPINNCIPLSTAMHRPPYFHLMGPVEIVEKVMQGCFLAHADMLAWFTQLKVSEKISLNFLRMRLRCGKEYAVLYAPQGWSYSPWLAQTVAKALSGEHKALSSITYDNFVWSGTAEEVEEAVQVFLEQCKRCGAEIAFEKSALEPATAATILGIHVNLETKTFGLDPEWSSRATKTIRQTARARSCSVRKFLVVVGVINWALQVLRLPWGLFRKTIDMLRRVASRVQRATLAYEDTVEVPQAVCDELEIIATEVVKEWQWRPPREPESTIYYSDASNVGYGAVVRQDDDTIQELFSLKWQNEQLAPIADREAFAMHLLMERLAEEKSGGSVHFAVDNAVLYFALLKGSSARRQVERHALAIIALAHHRNVTLFVSLVPTKEMLADAASRGDPSPTTAAGFARPRPVRVHWLSAIAGKQ